MTNLPARVLTGLLLLNIVSVLPCRAQGRDEDVATPRGMQKVFVHDPVFNMDAFEVFVPAKWHFQGTVVQGTSCVPVPFVVFRATSPDGLTMLEKLPNLDWKWGTSPMIGKTQGDCLPLKKAMSAQDMLKYVAGSMGVEYVGDSPVPADLLAMVQKNNDDARAKYAGRYGMASMKPPTQTTDLARAIVRFKNGTFTMKGLLSGTVNCTESTIANPNPRMPPWTTNTCDSSVRYVHAPEARFDAAVALLDPKNAGAFALARWGQVWMADNQARTQRNIAAINRQGAQNIANIQAQGDQFRHSQEVRQHMSDDFNATLKRGTQMSMNQTGAAMQARSTASSNWVNYSLDQQTVRDPATGAVNTVTSAYSYTWVDSTGRTSFQTNDVNVNPNGALTGNWTKQQVVNGDGTPK
jgi:hypothetical protein